MSISGGLRGQTKVSLRLLRKPLVQTLQKKKFNALVALIHLQAIIHVSRMHPDTNNTQCHSNVDNNSHCQSNVKNVTGTSSTATWGIYDTETIRQNIELVYEKVVYWRQNLFKLPSGAAGKAFI